MKVYIVTDTNADIRVSVHATEAGARAALLEYLKNSTGYTPSEWVEFAEEHGYDSVEEFQEAIASYGDYDDAMMMSIEEVEVED